MSGMIRLRPTQILLTSEEVNKALHKSRPNNSQIHSDAPKWSNKITVRRNRNARGIDRAAQGFSIHEDIQVNNHEAEGGDAYSGELSDMSDFSFGPIILRKSLDDGKTPFPGASSSSEVGDESTDDERSSESTSWDGKYSITTLTDGNDNFSSSTLIDGSISSSDEQQGLNLEVHSDDRDEQETSTQGENFIDLEYMADVELSVAEDSGLSAPGSDEENLLQESYSLPMDGPSEGSIRRHFQDMNLYASPVASSRYEGRFISREAPASGTTENSSTPDGNSLPATPPSVRRLIEEVFPRLDEIAGLSPRHLAVSRARLARHHPRSIHQSALTGQADPDFHLRDNHHQRAHTSGVSPKTPFNSSPPSAHMKRLVIIDVARAMEDEFYDTNTDDSDGGVEVLVKPSGTGKVVNAEEEDKIGDVGGGREDASRKMFG